MVYFGEIIGAGVLFLVTITAILLMRKARSSTAAFIEDEHEIYLGRKRD